jgi:hypothetical protein
MVASHIAFTGAMFAALLATSAGQAAVLTESNPAHVFAGTFAQDDDLRIHDFQVGGASAVSIVFETFSYAGGALRDGTIVPAGGFDPVISLFDAHDRLLAVAEDGGRRRDASTLNAYDDFLVTPLLPGAYRIVVSQYDNFPIAPIGGLLGLGFSREGTGNFTLWDCPAGAISFCDAGRNARIPSYVLEVHRVPLPASAVLMAAALAILAGIRRLGRCAARATSGRLRQEIS